MPENSKKLSEIYSKIFKVYLDFSPTYRRNLIDLKQMFDWLKEIEYNPGISDYPDFFLLMEWFNSINLIKPFFVVHFPAQHPYHICYNQQEVLVNNINNTDLKTLYEEGYLCFPAEIYNIKPSSSKNISNQWNFKKIKHKIKVKAKNASENGQSEIKIAIEETIYFYHPIQFFQLITYLQAFSYRDLLNKKQYKEFYWSRRFNFDDWVINRIKKYLKEEEKSTEEFIKEEISHGSSFHQIHGILFGQNRWLIERSLLLWLKLEPLFNPTFYTYRFSREISLDWQVLQDKKFNKLADKYYDWREKIFNSFPTFFEEGDFKKVNEFRVRVERYLRIDGLDNFIDLFLRINAEKKNKLKRSPNYFVNMLEIVKTLRLMEHELIRNFPNLSKISKESKWYEPKYFFEDENEEIEYNKKILLDYGIFQEEKFVVFVEGDTELILLDDWLRMMFFRRDIKISLKKLPSGKKTASHFKNLVIDFKGSEFFLILDADTPNYIEGKKAELSGAGIDEDSYKIFIPDFITANYSIDEVFGAFLTFFKEIKEKIELNSEKKIKLSDSEKQKLLNDLKDKAEFDKYEDIIENFLKSKLNKENYKLKKTNFANHLLAIQIKNFSKTSRNRYQFEEVLGKFIDKIQRIRFPELN